jgi:phosphoglycerate dehydrogenase-like enzyme
MMQMVVAGAGEVDNLDALRRELTTKWQIIAVPVQSRVDDLRAALSTADAFVGHRLDPADLAVAKKLQLIHCTGAGTDGFDIDSFPPGCTLCNVYEHEVPIAEYVIANVLLFATNQATYEARFRRGDWLGSARLNGQFHEEVSGRTLGLIGFGRIGREVARRAKAFGMRVIAVRRRPAPDPLLDECRDVDDLDQLLRASDYVVIACPLAESTRSLLGERQLRQMKSTAVLINVARAEVVEEEPLYRALVEHWFRGGVLDVWYRYPSSLAQRPFFGSKFRFHELDNVVITPHMAAWTRPMIERRCRCIAANLDRLARGEPLESVVHVAPSHLASESGDDLNDHRQKNFTSAP